MAEQLMRPVWVEFRICKDANAKEIRYHLLFLGHLTEDQARWVYGELETKAQELRMILDNPIQRKK